MNTEWYGNLHALLSKLEAQANSALVANAVGTVINHVMIARQRGQLDSQAGVRLLRRSVEVIMYTSTMDRPLPSELKQLDVFKRQVLDFISKEA